MSRQYIACKFRPADRRTYTYHNDGDPVAVGDEVMAPSARSDDGWQKVHVVAIVDEPEFETKGLLGTIPPEQADLLGADS